MDVEIHALIYNLLLTLTIMLIYSIPIALCRDYFDQWRQLLLFIKSEQIFWIKTGLPYQSYLFLAQEIPPFL